MSENVLQVFFMAIYMIGQILKLNVSLNQKNITFQTVQHSQGFS